MLDGESREMSIHDPGAARSGLGDQAVEDAQVKGAPENMFSSQALEGLWKGLSSS